MDYLLTPALLVLPLPAVLLPLMFLGPTAASALPTALSATYLIMTITFFIFRLNPTPQGVTNSVSWLTLPDSVPVVFSLTSSIYSIEFSLVLLFLGFLIQVYSLGYFGKDPELPRFSVLLGLFIFFMLMMINTDSLVFFFVSWEGVGLLSFMLVSFWYSKVNTLKSGFKVLFYNRIGDFFFFLVAGILLYSTKSDTVQFLNTASGVYPGADWPSRLALTSKWLLTFSLLLVLLSKSAQFGFHIWLLEAMEAPLPASSLIHSATLVCAGVVLYFKFGPVFMLCGGLTPWVTLWAACTSGLLSASALLNYDIKKVLAYSTGSHVSVMLAIAGAGLPPQAFSYTLIHASSKVFLFLLFGLIIDANGGIRDLRKMGAFFSKSELSLAALLGLTLLSSLPITPLAALKDTAILGLHNQSLAGEFSGVALMLSSVLNYAYMTRLLFKIFFGDSLGSATTYYTARYGSYVPVGTLSKGSAHLIVTPVVVLVIYILLFESSIFFFFFYDYAFTENRNVQVLSHYAGNPAMSYLAHANSFFFAFVTAPIVFRLVR